MTFRAFATGTPEYAAALHLREEVLRRPLGLRLSEPDLAAESVCFHLGAFDGPLGPALENPGHQRFHLAGKLELNHWNGRTRVQLRLDDAAPA